MEPENKREIFAHVKEAYGIAERLYREGNRHQAIGNSENPYREIYSWINKQISRGVKPLVVLHVLRIVDRKHGLYGATPRDLYPYFNGVLKGILEEKEAKNLRGGMMSMADLLGPALKKMKGF